MGLSKNCGRLHPGLAGSIVVLALSLPRGADARAFQCAVEDVSCLLQAINEANANGHPRNTIHLAPGTYTLMSVDNQTDGSNGLPSITSTLKIDAPWNEMATITRAAGALSFRLFHVAASGHLTLERITLTSGGFGLNGGGVLNNGGEVTIRGSAFIENEAATGGGLSNVKGKVTIRNSTFLRNVAFSGGALANDGGDVTIVDSIFDRNDSGLTGGALRNESKGILRIKRSHLTGNTGGSVGGILNGGFGPIVGGALWIDETTFSGNTGEIAGAIWARSEGTIVVKDSAFVENALVFGGNTGGGGAAIRNSGTAVVTNTTFARNGLRGLVRLPLAIHSDGTLVLTNSTFAEHTGGVFLEPILSSDQTATTILLNTILTHQSGDPTVQDCVGPIISVGHNLISDPSGCAVTLQPSDLTGNAGLDALTDDGTPGNGHFPLLKDSQAIDAGNEAFCPRRDQIGEERRGRCDIGAIEFQPKKHGHHGKHDHGHDVGDDSSLLD